MTFDDREWLETDGLGGFASGTVGGRRTRRYHALLLTAANPPTGRCVLINGIEAFVTTDAGSYALSTQHYAPNVIHPDGQRRIESFSDDPWPTWIFRCDDGTRVRLELFVPHGFSATVLRWTLIEGSPGRTTLTVRPLMSGRDYHSMHHENGGFQFEPQRVDERLNWQCYPGIPGIDVLTNGAYDHAPLWYRNFFYAEEAERGLDAAEDLASPGVLRFDLTRGPGACVLTASGRFAVAPVKDESALRLVERLAQNEMSRRAGFLSRLDRSADDYIVRRGAGRTIIAGYPWFTDWGRDTFIALRGLCLATGRLDDAGQILGDWASTVSRGMLPNRFPDQGDEPEFNSVDASLWYVIAVHDYLQAMRNADRPVSGSGAAVLQQAVEAILEGFAASTRYGIRADEDGLLRAGEPGVQLTWMDAKLGDWVVTPRSGKPVEIQALWINALWVGSQCSDRWKPLFSQAFRSFGERFWSDGAGCLYDVIDVDHRPGEVDGSLRPNQIFAVGGLPLCLLKREQARQVVDAVEQHLLTPAGLRTLDPASPQYRPFYRGGVWERDSAYHQGTVWPWLMGAFVEAWVRVRGNTAQAKRQARERFVRPLLKHLQEAGLGHLSEIADGDATPTADGPQHIPRGCPFQAWSVGELLRLDRVVLAEPVTPARQDAEGEAEAEAEAGVEWEGETNCRDCGRPMPASTADESLRSVEPIRA